MPRAIKFPLNINGAPVRSLEELQKNFCLFELYDLYESGKLTRWLGVYNYETQLEKLQEIKNSDCYDIGLAFVDIFKLPISNDDLQRKIDKELVNDPSFPRGFSSWSEETLELYKKGARLGSLNALNALGFYCKSIEDIGAAIIYYTQAAKQSSVEAMAKLGTIFFEKVNYKEAIIWFEKAINMSAQGVLWYDYAKFYLAVIHFTDMSNIGLPANTTLALTYLEQLADHESPICGHALAILGHLYYKGVGGVEADYIKASCYYIKMFDLMGFGVYNDKIFVLATMYELGHGESSKEQAKALELYAKLAERNHPKAMIRLAAYYIEKQPPEIDKAKELLNKARECDILPEDGAEIVNLYGIIKNLNPITYSSSHAKLVAQASITVGVGVAGAAILRALLKDK